MNVSLFLLPSLGLFYFCWFALSDFVLSYSILFFLFSYRFLFFCNERQKVCGFSWDGRWRRTGRVNTGETVTRIYSLVKESMFNKGQKESCLFYQTIYIYWMAVLCLQETIKNINIKLILIFTFE